MKIRYLSDIHLEFLTPVKVNKIIKKIPPGFNEVCVLAGDIGNPFHERNYNEFMKFINKNFMKSFVITGNHEYYNKKKTISEINDYLEDYFKQYENITFLNNSYEIYNNNCFIGTTLWSKIIEPHQYCTNDVVNIPSFDFKKCNELNKKSKTFLNEILAQQQENCIIITHYVPSESLIDEKYMGSDMLRYNQWFYSDMDEFIETNKNKIKCWIYGHTHTQSIIMKNNVPFLCNPIGYPGENKKQDFATSIKIIN